MPEPPASVTPPRRRRLAAHHGKASWDPQWRVTAHPGQILVLPSAALAVALIAYPFAYNVWLSLTDRSARRPGEFVGLANYEALLSSMAFHETVARTVFWTVGTVVGQIVLGLGLALLLNRAFVGRSVARASLLIPYALSTVVVVFIWRWLLNDVAGPINLTLMSLGVIRDPIVFLGGPVSAMVTVIVVAIWQATPFTVLLLLAGLQGIPRELYEAVRVDGGSSWTEFRHVTLPLLRPILATIVLIKTIWTFNWFDLVWLFTGGGPADATRTLAVAVYQQGFRAFRFGEAAAIGVLMFVCICLLAVPMVRLAERDA